MAESPLRPGGIAVGQFDAARRLRQATPDFGTLLGLRVPPATGEPLDSLLGRLCTSSPCGVSSLEDAFRCCSSDGRQLELAERPLPDGGCVLAVVDTTALNHVADALRASREVAEAGARAKARFLSTMNHELRTPLNAVIGFAETLAFDAARPDAALNPVEVEEYARHIRDAGRHLLSLIDDVLDLVRLDSGTAEIAADTLDASRLLQSARLAIEPAAQAAGLAVSVGAATEPLRLRGDERRLRRLLAHLLDNAVKFSRRGGAIALCAARTPEGDVALSVTDQGVGMAAEDLQRALLPFHQLDTRLARRVGGAGLGLHFCRAVAEAHGGSLRLVSQPGAGTTATLVLPAARLVGLTPFQQLAQEQPRTEQP